jgi:hypothetical protein
MKVAAAVALLAVAGSSVAYGQRRDKEEAANAVRRACEVADCFLERDVRDFDVVDKTHVIVYVGAQRCAFHVEVRGGLCDLTFAPELYFRRANELPDGQMPRGGEPASDRALVDPFDPFETARERRDLRVCSNDLAIEVHGGTFTESPSPIVERDRLGNPRVRVDCRVLSVRAITDDQLLEFFVSRDVVPPVPPMGSGQIEVGEQEEQGTAPTTSGGAGPADNEER